MQTPNQILAETILASHPDAWDRIKTLALDDPAFEVRTDIDGVEVILVKDGPEAGWLTPGGHLIFAYRLDAATQFCRFEVEGELAENAIASLETSLNVALRLVPMPA